MSGGFATKTDGKYTIRAVQQGDRWAARAFRGKATATATLFGADRAAAMAAVGEALSKMRAARQATRGADEAPSVDEYREAFAKIGPLHPNRLAMLKAHLAAPDHLITATQLAAAAGYANWNAANLQYGQLAQRLAEELDYTPPVRDDGTPIWTATLATWAGEGDMAEDRLIKLMLDRAEQPHFQWHLRPQVREVVCEL